MKKVVIFLVILLISFVPVAGKSLHEFCSKEKKAPVKQLPGDEAGDHDIPERSEFLLTRFLYTL